MPPDITVGYITQNHYNIGNAFIDIGAIEELKLSLDIAFDSYSLIPLSDHSLIRSSVSEGLKGLANPLWRAIGEQIPRSVLDRIMVKTVGGGHRFNLIEHYDLDFLVISGCILTVPYFQIHKELLKRLSDSGTRIIFMGAGSNSYSDVEQEYLSSQLEQIDTSLLISRDRPAFELYAEFFNDSMDGIDSAFFLNHRDFKSPKLQIGDYSVLTFDKPKSDKVEKKVAGQIPDSMRIIKANHSPHPVRSFRSVKPSEEDFISDLPEDYLRLYAGAEEVHSDRIHACVPTIALGGKCRLHNEKLRAPMFEKVTDGNITQELTGSHQLENVQNTQIGFLGEHFRQLYEE